MFSWWLTKCSEIVVLVEGNRASLTVWEKRAFNNSNTAQRFIRPLIRRADKVGRDQTPQTSLGVIPRTEKWTIPLTGPWKEEVQSRGSLKNSWVWAELAWRWGRKERNESVVTWRCLTRTGAMWWCHWETAGEWRGPKGAALSAPAHCSPATSCTRAGRVQSNHLPGLFPLVS